MNSQHTINRRVAAPSALSVVCAVALAACGGGGGGSGMTTGSTQLTAQSSAVFADTPLVANKVGVVATTTMIDANLQNPWGVAVAPGLPFWIADNANSISTLYDGAGDIETDTITGSNSVGIAFPASAAGDQANPTGQVYNASGGFLIQTVKGLESAQFIFDGQAGIIAGWAADSGATTVIAYDDSVVNGSNHAVYKGVAIGSVNGATFLYASDLHNNKVDVFDSTFSKPAAMQGQFIDPTIPAGFVPFNIQAVSGQLYVTYVMLDSSGHEVLGAGLGYVDVFDMSGNFVTRFASGGSLNAPWGIAVAPSGFGAIAGDVLIGNFGDGTINIFTPSGSVATFVGQLMVSDGGTFTSPGLWSLVFGNGDPDKPVTTLFYTAGFADQTDGVFGSIAIAPTTAPAPVVNPYAGY
jgi:uncharacterized protein (TIGR03118 family)